jgi:hypothetical protein
MIRRIRLKENTENVENGFKKVSDAISKDAT